MVVKLGLMTCLKTASLSDKNSSPSCGRKSRNESRLEKRRSFLQLAPPRALVVPSLGPFTSYPNLITGLILFRIMLMALFIFIFFF